MNENRADPRHNPAFQRGFADRSARSESASGPDASTPPEAAEPAPPRTTGAVIGEPDASGDRTAWAFNTWTVVLFVVGIGLCIVSFALFSDFNGGRWGSIEATRGGDWVVTDTSGSEQRTVSEFEYLLYRYFSQSSIWIGVIGLAAVVGNLFRIAPRRRF